MIDKRDVIAFFDRLAPDWDAQIVRNDAVIDIILDNAGVRAGVDVLDVACGTGVLFPDYLRRGARSVTAIDISPEMARIAAEKCQDSRIAVRCGDVERADFGRTFDVVVLYNAFPHFPDPEKLIAALARHTTPGGRVTIAHGASRAKIDSHHHGAAARVSNGLMSEDRLKALLEPIFDVDVVISDNRMFQLAGTKRSV